MSDFIAFIFAIMLGLVAVVVFFTTILSPLWIGGYLWDRAQCHAKYEEFKPDYGFIQGCIVEYDGKRIPADKLWIDVKGDKK